MGAIDNLNLLSYYIIWLAVFSWTRMNYLLGIFPYHSCVSIARFFIYSFFLLQSLFWQLYFMLDISEFYFCLDLFLRLIHGYHRDWIIILELGSSDDPDICTKMEKQMQNFHNPCYCFLFLINSVYATVSFFRFKCFMLFMAES